MTSWLVPPRTPNGSRRPSSGVAGTVPYGDGPRECSGPGGPGDIARGRRHGARRIAQGVGGLRDAFDQPMPSAFAPDRASRAAGTCAADAVYRPGVDHV